MGSISLRTVITHRTRLTTKITMKFFAASCLALVACQIVNALPRPDGDDSEEVVPILRDDRTHEDGHYSFDTEAGQPEGDDGAVHQAGQYSFTSPNGESFELKFVADENGFQPESDYLPVAPAFPHPIPDFVLEQIEKARIEDEEAARKAAEESD